MTVLSLVIENHLDELELLPGPELLPSHRQALRAMVRCPRQGSDLMVLECPDCKTNLNIPHSCGHRSCPNGQHHESQQWLDKQQGKVLPVTCFMVTFTVPAEMRPLFWTKQRICSDPLLKTAWETIDSFARRVSPLLCRDRQSGRSGGLSPQEGSLSLCRAPMLNPGEEAPSRARCHAHRVLPQSGSKPVKRPDRFAVSPSL